MESTNTTRSVRKAVSWLSVKRSRISINIWKRRRFVVNKRKNNELANELAQIATDARELLRSYRKLLA